MGGGVRKAGGVRLSCRWSRSFLRTRLIEYFGTDADGDLLFTSFVAASPGDASLSFFGIVFR